MRDIQIQHKNDREGGNFNGNSKRTRVLNWIGYFCLAFGMITTLFFLFIDIFRGEKFNVGLYQVVLIVLGILLVLLGLALINPRAEDLLGKIFGTITSKHTLDIVCVVVFGLYAALSFLGKWEGLTPSPELWSDAATVASFAAANDHPENFVSDTLLGNPKDAAPYKLFPLPLLSVLTKLTGDYSLSLLILLPVSIFLQLLGFYLLGKRLFYNPIFGVVLSILCAVNIQYGAGDYWGFFTDPQPRFMYQAVFPFVILLFFHFFEKPKYWPLVMLAAGVAGYIHFLSSPVLPFILWLGFFISKPEGLKFTKKLGFQAINAMVYLLTMIPVMPIFLQNTAEPEISTINMISQTASTVSNTNIVFERITSVAVSYFNTLNIHRILIPFVLGILLVFLINRRQKRNLLVISIWILGILFISLGFPFLFRPFEEFFTLLPITFDLTRELRYTYPLYYIVVLFGMEGIILIFKEKVGWKRITVIGLLITGLAIWLVNSEKIFNVSPYFFENPVAKEIKCLKEGRLFCPIPARLNEVEVMVYLRDHTPITNKVMAIPNYRLTEQIRYGGLRTSSLSIGDTARLGFSATDFSNLTSMYEEYKSMKDPDKGKEFDQFVSFACKLDTDYLLADMTIPLEVIKKNGRINLEMSNDDYNIAKIIDCSE